MAKKKQRLVDDEVIETRFSMKQLGRLLVYAKPYVFHIILAFVLMMIASVASIFSPYMMQEAIDGPIADNDMRGLMYFALIMLGLNLVNVVCSIFRQLILTKVGQKIILKLRSDLFRHIQDMSFTFFDSRPVGKILARIINDVNALSDLITNGLFNILIEAFGIIVLAVLIFNIDITLSLLSLAGIPLLVIWMLIFTPKARDAWSNVSKKSSTINAFIHEQLSGIKTTQAFTREKKAVEEHHRLNNEYKKTWLKAIFYSCVLNYGSAILSIVGLTLVYIAGVYMVQNEIVTVGIVVGFSNYSTRFWGPILSIMNYFNTLNSAAASMERIFEMLDEKNDIVDAPDATVPDEWRGRVEFENVTFYYDEEKPVLENVSFKVAPGETVALVGPTGAGKSTIVNLVARFYDVKAGSVLIDGIDIRQLKQHELRRHIGMMLQEPYLFTGTIRENIRYGRLDATDEEIENAAKIVCAHDFIMDLPAGYDTIVQERGGGISQGQRQLISFARALLSDPTILVLDEATSNIDTKTEMMLQKGLNELMKGRTTFVIAHRLSTIKSADDIMVIAERKIYEHGTHDELVAQGGLYAELNEAQYRFMKITE